MRRLLLSLCAASSLVTVASSAHAVASAELYQTPAEFYGRFEARIRFAPGDGVISSFFLWKSGSEVTGAYWNELDFEKLGADCHLQTNAIYGAPSAQHSQVNAVAADLCGAYHTYGFEWAPTYVSWQIDGTEVRRDTGATAAAFAQNATAGMQIHVNVWPGDASFGGNFDPAILPVYQDVSWVQYSTYANGAFSLAWRQEFDGGTLPSGWATGNWASPKGYSTNSAANVNFVDGISVLSLTSDAATGFTGTPPTDGASGGSVSTAGTGEMPAGGMSGGVAGAGIGAASGGVGGVLVAGLAGFAGNNQHSETAGAANVGGGGNQAMGGAAAAAGARSGEAALSASSSGCSCSFASERHSLGAPMLLLLVASAAITRRRRSVAVWS